MSPVNIFICISLCVTVLYALGVVMFLTDHAENKCEMTYMFEYPQFVRIRTKLDSVYPKYALYAYSEGHLTERARNMQFDGIPVLFIPGNAGSYKQVRSLASVALRKSLNSRPGFHFDYFTVDLNGELSGLNGALLYEQRKYVNQSAHRILELYVQARYRPTSVVLVGHSMGGVIAKSLLGEAFGAPLLITLATPHARSPALLDYYTYKFYASWNNSSINSEQTTLVSVAGSYNDFLIPSYFSNIRSNNSLYVVSTKVPKTWLPTDHLCILWCKQLVLAINRALFDSVDLKTKQISNNPDYRLSTFNHHLSQHSGTKIRLAQRYLDPVTINDHGEWFESMYRQYSIELSKGTGNTKWYMIRYDENPRHESVTVLAVSLEHDEWVYACPAVYSRGQSRVCKDGIHLTHLSTIEPSVRYKRRKLELNIHQLKKNYTRLTHVVVKLQPTDDPVALHFDVHSNGERIITVTLPHLFSFKEQIVIEQTADNAIRYDIILPHLTHLIQSYKLFVKPANCTKNIHHAAVSLIVPWANEDVHSYITDEQSDPIHIRLHSSKPKDSNISAIVKLTLDPACRYQISVAPSLTGTLGQISRFYSVLLIANVATIILMMLRYQLSVLGESAECPTVFTSLKHGVKPYYILTGVKVVSKVLSYEPFLSYLPETDWVTLTNENIDFLLPLILYLCSIGLVWMVNLVLTIGLISYQSSVNKIALKFLARNFTGTVFFSDYLMSALHKVPIFVAVCLCILSATTCGGLALALGAVFYFLKLTQMSQDYIEELLWNFVKKLSTIVRGSKKKETKDDSIKNEQSSTEEVQEAEEQATDEQDTLEKKEETDNDESEPDKEVIDELAAGDAGTTSEPEQVDEKNEAAVTVKDIIAVPTEISFHITLFLLWTITASLCVPSVLTWAHNFKYSTSLNPDPSFIPGLVLSLCAIPLWQLDVPKVNRVGYQKLSIAVFAAAFITLLYATLSLYRLTYLLTGVFVLVTLQQVLLPDVAVATDSGPDDSYASRVKAKWE